MRRIIDGMERNRYKNMAQTQLNRIFLIACENADMGLIDYLMHDNDIQRQADVRHDNDRPLKHAMVYNRKEVINFFMQYPELHLPLLKATKDVLVHNPHEQASYLIVEKKMPMSQEIEEFIDLPRNEDLKAIFSYRDIMDNLNEKFVKNKPRHKL